MITLRQARREVGLKQSRLAELAEVDQRHLSLLENNRYLPSKQERQQICEVLELKEDEVYFPQVPQTEIEVDDFAKRVASALVKIQKQTTLTGRKAGGKRNA